MSSNPNNAIGTNAAYSGRTSVNAFNDVLSAFSRGVVSGWACVPNSGLTVSLGGDGSTRDVAIAVDNTGNATTINNISNSPVDVTISSAPASNSRIDLIVAYVDNPPQGVSTTADNPAACGLVVVKGTVAASPVAPNESAIRTAITSDGASGTTAYYVVLAQILIATGTTTLTSDNITQGSVTTLSGKSVQADNIDFSTIQTATPSSLGYTTSGGTFTAPNTGYVLIQCAVAGSSAYLTIKLNTNTVARVQGGGQSAFVWIPVTLFVGKGDIVEVTSSDSGGNAQVLSGNSNFIAIS